MNVTREQLNAALAELAACGSADAIGNRLFREGCRGEAVEACRCPIVAWLRRHFPQARHVEVYPHVVIVDGVLSASPPKAVADFTLRFDRGAYKALAA
jgi:hypothetical protein